MTISEDYHRARDPEARKHFGSETLAYGAILLAVALLLAGCVIAL